MSEKVSHRAWIKLSYAGSDADEHELSLYDLSQALYGFERSLALTTHLILNDEIITQATALRGARIIAKAPRAGSFEILACIGLLAAGGYKITTLKKDNPLGHLVFSAYDYAVRKVVGMPLDYDKSLAELYEKSKFEQRTELKLPSKKKFNSLAEKIEPPLTRMHRPIIRSESAETARLEFPGFGKVQPPKLEFDRATYARIKYRERADEIEQFPAIVSVFNPNTFNGRLFLPAEERTIPFFLTHAGRSSNAFNLIGESYSKNLSLRGDPTALIYFDAFRVTSKLGRITKFNVIGVRPLDALENDDLLIDE